jgi:hypothetical protein
VDSQLAQFWQAGIDGTRGFSRVGVVACEPGRVGTLK